MKSNKKILWDFLKGSKRFFIVGMIATLMISLTGMVTPQMIRISIDNVILNTETNNAFIDRLVDFLGGADYLRSNLWVMAIMLIVVASIAFVSDYLYRVGNTYACETLTKTMRDQLFDRIAHMPFSWLMKNHTGDIIQRCTSDIDTIKNFISEQLTNILRMVLLFTFSIVITYTMNWKLALIATAFLPIIFLYSLIFHTKIKSAFNECDESEGKLSSMVQENLTGVRVVRAFGKEKFEKERFVEYNAHYTSLWVRLAKIMAKFWTSSDVISGLEIMSIIVCGAVFAVKGELTVGEYIAFISYNELLIWPLRMLGRMLAELSKAGVSMNRIAYIVNSDIEKDKEGAIECDMSGDIAFEHINFAYDNCPELLHDVDFKVKAGQTIGIMGGTGSGKSTLMMLLDKLYDLQDPASSIKIGGVDIRDISTECVRRNIGMVLQEPYLFSRKISENISIGNDQLTLDDIRNAAKAAAIDETIMSFKEAYDTFVGERGVTLSGGQKQRTAIARALTEPKPILIFDDSLSAVDTETDHLIRASLEERFGTCTIFLISHRISTLQKADKIILLENGSIKEMGTHNELLELNGLYAEIYKAQTMGVTEL